jgi:hypothetical protein
MGGLKLFFLGEKIDRKTQIEGPIDDESIDFVKGIQCCINMVQFGMESFGKDACPRAYRDVDDDYDRYKCNLFFKGWCEVE